MKNKISIKLICLFILLAAASSVLTSNKKKGKEIVDIDFNFISSFLNIDSKCFNTHLKVPDKPIYNWITEKLNQKFGIKKINSIDLNEKREVPCICKQNNQTVNFSAFTFVIDNEFSFFILHKVDNYFAIFDIKRDCLSNKTFLFDANNKIYYYDYLIYFYDFKIPREKANESINNVLNDLKGLKGEDKIYMKVYKD